GAAARGVAMIVTSLVEGDGPPGEAVATEAPVPPARPATDSLWSVILGAGLEHQSMKFYMDEGLDSHVLRGGLARSLAPNLRAIATVGAGYLKPQYSPHSRIVPIR